MGVAIECPGCLDADEECKGPDGVGEDMLITVADYEFGTRGRNITCACPKQMTLIDNNLKSRCGIRSLSKVKAWGCRDESVKLRAARWHHAITREEGNWCAIIKMPQDEREPFLVKMVSSFNTADDKVSLTTRK